MQLLGILNQCYLWRRCRINDLTTFFKQDNSMKQSCILPLYILFISLFFIGQLQAQNSFLSVQDTLYFIKVSNPKIKLELPVANEEITIHYKNGEKDHAYIIGYQNDSLKIRCFSELSNIEYYQWKIDNDSIKEKSRRKRSLFEARYKNIKSISLNDIYQINVKYSSIKEQSLIDKIGGIFFLTSIPPTIVLSMLYVLPLLETEHFIPYYIIGATIFIDGIYLISKTIVRYKYVKPENWIISSNFNNPK
jgi:hypothetical protein